MNPRVSRMRFFIVLCWVELQMQGWPAKRVTRELLWTWLKVGRIGFFHDIFEAIDHKPSPNIMGAVRVSELEEVFQGLIKLDDL